MSRQPRATRAASAACVALAVLGVHLALWREWTKPARLPAALAAPLMSVTALDVRSLPAPPPEVRAPLAQAAPARATAGPRPASPPSPSPVTTAEQRPARLRPAPELPPLATSRDLAQPPALVQAEAAEAALPAPPVYATRLPSPGRWRYRMERGAVSGEAELNFELLAAEAGDAPGYTLQLTARAAGVAGIDWASRGQLDAAGLAPERFALRRKGRDRQAANFQRDAGKITFSGPTHAHPLPAGAQDRLSWLLQLTAIVAAAPESFGAGSQVQIYVAGARGDAQVWVFSVEGRELLEGGVRTLKLVREPVRLYDTRAEVWLDPQRQFLPQRVLQTPQGGGPALNLTYEPGPS